MKIERLNACFEFKNIGDDGSFSGYGSIFGNVDMQNEVVAKGAFVRSLRQYAQKSCMPAMLWMHDPTQPIGAWTSISEDEKGLAVSGQLAMKTQKGAEAYELMKMKAMKGLSIGYRVVKSQVDSNRKARILTDVDLFEISLVTFPANEAAGVDVVKAVDQIKTIRDFEEYLRDGGFSHAAAESIARGGFKARTESRDENVGLDELAAEINRVAAILQPKK